jgi:quinoprotein glucose dehydrogenase
VRKSARNSIAVTLASVVIATAALLAQNTGTARPMPSTARGEWPTYGGDLSSSKYSPLDQINATNFKSLKLAWRAKSPDAQLSITLPGNAGEWTAPFKEIFDELNRLDPKRWRDGAPPFVTNFKATPLMVNGTLYLNSPSSVGAALDAKSGAVKWIYNPKSYESGTTTMSARWNQRGVGYWTDGTEERVFWGTGDGYLISVDAKTGKPVQGFGVNGKVDLMDGLPRAKRGERDHYNALTYSVQSPPFVVRDIVITPASISSYLINKEQIPGYLRAYDAKTGKLRWTFKTVPTPGEFGNETWEADSWSYAGKVTTWSMMSADPELGLVFMPTNTTAPDYYGGHRPGNNLFAESILALDINTGLRKWHFQTVHHGLWDYDNPAAPNLLDVNVNGRRIKALAQITKQGFIYTFDRETGQPVWPIEERPVAPSDIPGEKASPTQPFPTRPAAFERQGVTIDDLVDFTPELRKTAIEAIKPYKIGPLFTPPTLQGTIMQPGASGGGNWSGAAVDPDTGMLFVPSKQGWGVIRLEERKQGVRGNLNYFQAPPRTPNMPGGVPLLKPPYSRMTAVNMNTGDHVWMTPAGNGDKVRNLPALKGLNLPPLGGDHTTAGAVLTKTLLIYPLNAGGSQGGPRLVAYDKASGKEIGSVDLPAAPIGTPMTYLVDGKQYIALTVAEPRQGEVPELVAFALP